jgi:hypothetical protein
MYEKCQTTFGSMKVCDYKLEHCNGHRTCETLISNETVEIQKEKKNPNIFTIMTLTRPGGWCGFNKSVLYYVRKVSCKFGNLWPSGSSGEDL